MIHVAGSSDMTCFSSKNLNPLFENGGKNFGKITQISQPKRVCTHSSNSIQFSISELSCEHVGIDKFDNNDEKSYDQY